MYFDLTIYFNIIVIGFINYSPINQSTLQPINTSTSLSVHQSTL
jgi:hypothetical protein